MTSEAKKEKDILEITKGENANLAGMEPRCPKCGSTQVIQVWRLKDGFSVSCYGCGAIFKTPEESHHAQFFRSPAPTPPLEVEAEKRITEIRERESKATKGPLVAGLDLPFVDNNDPDKRMVWSNSLMVADFRSVWIKQEQSEADAEFYAHSRQDIPFLLEQISLLRRHIASPAPQLKLKIQELVGLPVDREIEDDLVFSAVKALHHAVGLCQHSHWGVSVTHWPPLPAPPQNGVTSE